MGDFPNSSRHNDQVISILIERARHMLPMTPAQRREQQVSWVYGQLPEGNKLTKEEIKEMIERDDMSNKAIDEIQLMNHTISAIEDLKRRSEP